MRKRTRVKRIRCKGFWVCVWLYQFIPTEPTFWEGALLITKSKRASCDWIENRKNRRSVRAHRDVSGAPSATVFKAMSLFQSLILQLPEDAVIFSKPRNQDLRVISRYLERIGFMFSPLDGQPCWILTAHSKEEVRRRSLRSSASTS